MSNPTLGELRALTDEEAFARYDEVAPTSTHSLLFWQAEIARRDADRQTRKIVWLTRAIAFMTLVMMVATLIIARTTM